MLIIQVQQQKLLSYDSIHQVYGENAYHKNSIFVILKICPKSFFFFFNRKSNLVRKQTFPKNYLCYIIYERQLEDNSGRFLCIVNTRPCSLWCFELPRSLSLVFGCKQNPKYFRNQNKKQKETFWLAEKTPIIQFLFMGKCLL